MFDVNYGKSALDITDMTLLERNIHQDIFLNADDEDDNKLLSYESNNQEDYKNVEIIEKVKTSNELEELFDASEERKPISVTVTAAAASAAGAGATSMTLSEFTAMVSQFLPTMYYNEFYYDLLAETKTTTTTTNLKRAKERTTCDCKVTNDLLDLGHHHYPRYLLNAVCQTHNEASEKNIKCLHGAICKPLKYKIKVLTFRKDPKLIRHSDDLHHLWKFDTVTVTAGCFCAN